MSEPTAHQQTTQITTHTAAQSSEAEDSAAADVPFNDVPASTEDGAAPLAEEAGDRQELDQPSRRFSSQEKGKAKEVIEQEDAQQPVLASPIEEDEPTPELVAEAPTPVPAPAGALAEPLAEVAPAPPSPSPPPVPAREDESEEKWKLKSIHWPPLPAPPSSETGQAEAGPVVKIVTQDLGGPCSLISVANVLILRGDIVITPSDRTHITYSQLSSLIAEHLLTRNADSADPALSAALAQLPLSRHGLDVNPMFHAVTAFKQSSETSGELALFRLCGIELLHGWLADMADEEQWNVLEECGDYDNATLKLVEASEITGGVDPTILENSHDEDAILAYAARASNFTPQQSEVVRKAVVINKFLRSSQLTYPGLVSLHDHLAPSAVAVLFFSSHLSVIVKRPTGTGAEGDDTQLFTLVTDASFAHENTIVWESLSDVDGANASFYSANLQQAKLARGDWTRRRAGRDEEEDADGSLALARQLQFEEEEQVRQRQAAWEEEERARELSEQQHEREQAAPPPPPPASAKPAGRKQPTKGEKGNKDKCVVM